PMTRRAAVHIALLFAWVVMFHPLAHAFDVHDSHLSGLTVGQACEFCHSNAGLETPLVLHAPTLADYEIVAEPVIATPAVFKNQPRGRAPPFSSCKA
ncbi:MAG: hypothetical protein KC800_14555, partial [Candidatus Eremiobacteraeota bacterium]|nr:hypothetical protein [Candidatus Eremiobacteraeota bacterium]